MKYLFSVSCLIKKPMVFLTILLVLAPVQYLQSQSTPWHIQAVTLEQFATDQDFSDQPPLIIAIVDDGVLIEHSAIRPFLWENSPEIPDNNFDDDGNGYVDDVYGWDAADEDGDVSPPQQRLQEYYHGTHLSGLIVQVATAALGTDAAKRLKIMPVKTLSDDAVNTQLKSAYKGIRYAIDAGADIILCAWSLSPISHEEKRLLDEATKAGILIVASAGNQLNEVQQFPAAHPDVIAVAATNRSNSALPESNYGQFVDIGAPGEAIVSLGMTDAAPVSEKSGSSFAAALVATSAALVRIAHPELSTREVKACLVNHTDPFDKLPTELAGKLGSGRLNIAAAVRCSSLFNDDFVQRSDSTRGYLVAQGDHNPWKWYLKPEGRFKAIRLTIHSTDSSDDFSGVLKYAGVKTDKGDGRKNLTGQVPIKSSGIASSGISLAVPGDASIQLHMDSMNDENRLLIEYQAETIDFTKEHCTGTETITSEGMISDGSGENDYAYHTDCKWLVIAPEGKRIKFDFTSMKTEPRSDTIYFFDGERTNKPIMAKFSGYDIPPMLITWHNKVLVWFLSDRVNQYAGWDASISFVD